MTSNASRVLYRHAFKFSTPMPKSTPNCVIISTPNRVIVTDAIANDAKKQSMHPITSIIDA